MWNTAFKKICSDMVCLSRMVLSFSMQVCLQSWIAMVNFRFSESFVSISNVKSIKTEPSASHHRRLYIKDLWCLSRLRCNGAKRIATTKSKSFVSLTFINWELNFQKSGKVYFPSIWLQINCSYTQPAITRQWRGSGVFFVNFEHILHLFLVFLLLTLSW